MKIKKFHVLFLLIFFSSFSLGQNITGNKMIQESPQIGAQTERIGKIKMFFCNDGLDNKNLKKYISGLVIRPGQSKNICMIFGNIGDKETNLVIGFSEGILNEQGQQVCDQDMGKNNRFSKMIYIKEGNKDNNLIFKISPGEIIVKKAKIKIPKTYSGNIYGCVSYKILGDVSRGSGSIFDVVIRKVGNIEMLITGSTYQYQRLDDTKEIINDNKIVILKFIIGVIGIRLVMSIIQSFLSKSKKKHHKK